MPAALFDRSPSKTTRLPKRAKKDDIHLGLELLSSPVCQLNTQYNSDIGPSKNRRFDSVVIQ